MDFAVPADKWEKIKEDKKKNKYLDFARELKKLSNMWVTVIKTIIGAFGTVPKGLERGLGELEMGGGGRDHPNHC